MATFRLRASGSIAAVVAFTSVAAVALGLSAVGVSACATATTNGGGGSADASTGDGAGGTPGGDGGDAGGGGGDAAGQVPGVGCNGAACDKGQTCCASNGAGLDISCAPACDPDGGSPVECDGPEDCDSLNPLCCAHVTGGPVEAAGCPWTQGVIGCTGRCDTSIGTTCGVDQTTARVCHTGADCAGGDPNTNCCEFRASALSIWMCVDDAHKTNARKCL